MKFKSDRDRSIELKRKALSDEYELACRNLKIYKDMLAITCMYYRQPIESLRRRIEYQENKIWEIRRQLSFMCGDLR